MIDPKDLRIVYMGTPDFAVEPLRALLNFGFNINAVVTAPDKPAGRGQKLSQSAVKEFAVGQNLRVLQPLKLKDQSFVQEITSIQPHIIIVVAFRMLPEVIWKIPTLGTFNLHASILPNYRGAAPINWAVINGESKTGLTTFLIDEKIDTGRIILRHEVGIDPNETAGELHDRLMAIGGDLVVRTVNILALGEVDPIPQESLIEDRAEIKDAPKLFKERIKINWNENALNIHNFIRGLSPYPAAWCSISDGLSNDSSVKIFRSKVIGFESDANEPGTILTDGKSYLHVCCGRGVISILEIQIAGKRNMPVKEFLLGFRDIEKYRFY